MTVKHILNVYRKDTKNFSSFKETGETGWASSGVCLKVGHLLSVRLVGLWLGNLVSSLVEYRVSKQLQA